LWESNFEPVVVEDFCKVRADFHPASGSAKHDIIITPKMSFGTGHHATTYMMIQQMRDLDFKGKAVADFGTGTGILAILAEKLGSSKVVAIDYDEWSIQNAEENILKNGCTAISLQQADTFSPPENFDIILANINRNVILDNLDGLVFGLNAKAFLLISGILKEDEKDIVAACINRNLSYIKTVNRNQWISILFAND
jgi:ribosomal protein L11 methyltransferase